MDDQDRLLAVLRRHPAGLREVDLLRELGHARFEDDLSLFRAHFLLFHALYELRDRVTARGEGDLAIGCARVALLPPTDALGPAAATAVGPPDALRAYYADLGNLTQTTGEDVAAMLDLFWRRYAAWDERGEALAALGLDPSADLDAAERRYRELAKRHHPDVGGDPEHLVAVNAAIAAVRGAEGRR